MSLSDDDDDDDDFFNDPDALQALRAAEIHAASQAVQTSTSQNARYHHTVSLPKVRPLNTEPRVTGGGFGWGDGGKHFGAQQMERIIAASKQQSYREDGPDPTRRAEVLVPEVAAGRKVTPQAVAGPSSSPQQIQSGVRPRTDESRTEEAGPSRSTSSRDNELQSELWRAKGEVETMRRTQKQEHARYSKETDRLKRQVTDMEQKLREKEKETARQLESLKTQAVFNNHAIYNSASRKQASVDASPKRKSKKPAFPGLVNAFNPPDSKTNLLPTPPPLPETEFYAVEDDTTEFIQHLFQQMSPGDHQPTFFRIVSAKESPAYDAIGAELLSACGEPTAALSVVSSKVMRLLVDLLQLKPSEKMLVAILEILTAMLLLYPTCSPPMETSGIGTWCKNVLIEGTDTLAVASGDLCVALCLTCDGRALWKGGDLVDIIINNPRKQVEIFEAASQNPTHFRSLAGPSETHHDQSLQPALDHISRLLLKPHQQSKRITDAFGLLIRANPDAPVLVGEKTSVIPATIIYLSRISSLIWGITPDPSSHPLDEIVSALSLLHGLVYPPPHDSNDPVGVNLGSRLHAAAQSREFSGIHHIFQATLGRMAYVPIKGSSRAFQTIQDFSQDLIDTTLEGPEGDAIYSLYVAEDPEEVDQDGYAAMEM